MTPVLLGTPVQDPGGLITILERRRSSWSRTDAIDPKPTFIKAQANGRVGSGPDHPHRAPAVAYSPIPDHRGTEIERQVSTLYGH